MNELHAQEGRNPAEKLLQLYVATMAIWLNPPCQSPPVLFFSGKRQEISFLLCASGGMWVHPVTYKREEGAGALVVRTGRRIIRSTDWAVR